MRISQPFRNSSPCAILFIYSIISISFSLVIQRLNTKLIFLKEIIFTTHIRANCFHSSSHFEHCSISLSFCSIAMHFQNLFGYTSIPITIMLKFLVSKKTLSKIIPHHARQKQDRNVKATNLAY